VHGVLRILTPDCSFPATFHPSPNHGIRKGGKTPDSILLHYTGLATWEAALDQLCNPATEVSAHYLVRDDGSLLQLVPEARRAWHAGLGSWAGETDMNDVSIGIEIANPGHRGGSLDYPPAQIATVIALCQDISARWGIAPHRVLGHSDVSPERKIDPGEFFPWAQLAQANVGHYVPPCPLEDGPRCEPGAEGAKVERLQALLVEYGYGLRVTGVYGCDTETIIRAFQRHFRPELVDGVADLSTVETLRNLIAARSSTRPIPRQEAPRVRDKKER
jgi:N-acetylmuramoyl-L-alanine amidase